MQVQVEIGFEQLVEIVKALPTGKLKRLKSEIDKEVKNETSKIDLASLLLNGPVATEKQLKMIAHNRKAIDQWRTKK